MAPNDLSLSMDLLIEAGYIGLVHADEDFFALSAFGKLATAVPLGSKICQSIPVLVGLDDSLLELRKANRAPLEIPNVRTFNGDGTDERVDYVIAWRPDERRYLVYISRTIAVDETAIELQREARRRRLVEEQLLLQAEAIREANSTLMEANDNLQDFTRIISHDLKAPLRAMRYFTDDLEASLGGETDNKAKAHIDRLKAQSRRMSAMISGLLAYCRVDHDIADGAGEPARTSQVVAEIISSLALPESFAIEAREPLDDLPAPAAIVDLIVRNLVENAIKHHDRGSGCIVISTKRDGGGISLTIEDDGPGIAPDLQEAAFNPFTQLRPDAGADGVGMGLALVKRAVKATDGTLRVLSNPDLKRGSCFTINWIAA